MKFKIRYIILLCLMMTFFAGCQKEEAQNINKRQEDIGMVYTLDDESGKTLIRTFNKDDTAFESLRDELLNRAQHIAGNLESDFVSYVYQVEFPMEETKENDKYYKLRIGFANGHVVGSGDSLHDVDAFYGVKSEMTEEDFLKLLGE